VAGLLFSHVGIAANTALTQPGGTIQGVVVDELGRPISEATIVVNGLSAGEAVETRTSSDGHYVYRGVAAGLYTITATKGGLGGEVFRIRVGDDRTVSVNFELAPGQRVASYLIEAGQREALSRVFATGIEASRSGSYEVAIDAFLNALDISPTCLECHYNLAIAYTELGRFAEAEGEFLNVLRLREDYAAAYYGLSSIYTRQGRESEAADARSEANRIALERVAVGRAQAEDAVARGVTFFNAGNVADAIGRFQAAVELDTTLAVAHYWLGLSFQQSGRDAPARLEFQRYLQLASSGEFAAEARERLESLGP
jgi:Flp pilus assembly protein TadD